MRQSAAVVDLNARRGWTTGEAMEIQRTGVIVGIPNLAEYLNVSRQTVYRYLSLGMPGNKIGDTWHFHSENVELWFKKNTMAIRKDLLEEIKSGIESGS